MHGPARAVAWATPMASAANGNNDTPGLAGGAQSHPRPAPGFKASELGRIAAAALGGVAALP